MKALDISNNTPRFTTDHVRRWQEEDDVGLAIIQLLSGVQLAGDDCATQIDICVSGGLAVDCYLFPPNDGLPLSTRDRLSLIPHDLRVAIRQFWCDIEKGYYGFPTRDQVSEVHGTVDLWAPWQRCGDYSALWAAQAMGWLPWPWPTRKQWLVHVLFSGEPHIGGAFSGTNNLVMTQYHEDVVLAGIGGMDLSLLTTTEEQQVLTWQGGPMAINVGDGMRGQMEASGDTPLCDHVYYTQVDDDGKSYDVEKCYGAQGLYISSNASGDWQNAGPL